MDRVPESNTFVKTAGGKGSRARPPTVPSELENLFFQQNQSVEFKESIYIKDMLEELDGHSPSLDEINGKALLLYWIALYKY